jgi:hypothetical protein
MSARREILRSALSDLGDEAVKTPADRRMLSWVPRREKYVASLFDVLASWSPSPELKATLTRGIFDEERSNQLGAARALARVYSGCDDVQQKLRATLTSSLELSVLAAALEALTLGWPRAAGLSDLHDQAIKSPDPTLRLVGISGRVAAGRAGITDRNALIELLSESTQIDFWERPAARDLLSLQWPDDPVIIAMALKAAQRYGDRPRDFERESAIDYLVRCSPSNSSVADWLRQELN